MPQTQQVHRLRPNHREWTPPQVAYLDTESRAEETEQGEIHTLRLWAARLVVRRTRSGKGLGESDGWGYDQSELADQIGIWTEGQRCLWLYTHNLSFDLAVTRLPAVLERRGWTVTGHAVASDSPWVRMKRGTCVLTICDSWGWLRAPLKDIGADVGHVKPDLPDWDDSDAAWLARCQADVDILARAMGQLMDWWDAEQLGSWTLTGSAGGWNTYRHRATMALPLIVPDPEQTEFDRRAIYGGRREAFRHGQLTDGPYTLLDFRSAYPSIAAAFPLPCARQGNFDSLPVDSRLICGADYGVIAQVTVQTSTPRYPVRVAGRVAYPVGRFVTVLAGPEIAEARRLGHLVAIGPGWLHKLSAHMADWARWVLDCTADDADQVPRVCRRAVKHWGRAVIGKSAARGWRTIPLETLGGQGWDYRPAWNAAQQAPSHLVSICGQSAEVISCGDGDNAYPAILAWVESWVRVFLSRAIDALAGLGVLTCDTDGLIVTSAGDWRTPVAQADLGPLTLREKGRYDQVQVIGPQHVIAPGDRKLSGIPRSAEQLPDGRLRALLWPGLSTQMQLRPGGTEPAFIRPYQTYSVPESTVTGWVTAGGDVVPLLAELCSRSQTHLVPNRLILDHSPPGVVQAKHLAQMVRALPPEGEQCTYHMPRSNGITGESPASGPTISSRSKRPRNTRAARKDRAWRNTGEKCVKLLRQAFSGKTRT